MRLPAFDYEIGANDLGQRYAKPRRVVLDDDDFAARHDAAVYHDIDGFADPMV